MLTGEPRSKFVVAVRSDRLRFFFEQRFGTGDQDKSGRASSSLERDDTKGTG
jgi:hypothetical protein